MPVDDLDLLQAEAARIDDELAEDLHGQQPDEQAEEQAEEQEHQAQLVSKADEIATLLTMAVGVASRWFPSVKPIWTPEAVREVAEAGAGMAAKYGIDLSLGRWQEEIRFFGAVGVLGVATYQAVLADLQARDDEPAAKVDAVPAGAGEGAHVGE